MKKVILFALAAVTLSVAAFGAKAYADKANANSCCVKNAACCPASDCCK